MWNAIIAFEGHTLDTSITDALVKVRLVAADCMHMSTAVLGGISARYNIDNLSLLKFYTACGEKYASNLRDSEMADVCFSRAAEFAQQLNQPSCNSIDTPALARAMFDLLIGRAECSWEKGDSEQAELHVIDARKYLEDLPGEHEFLASVEYNFGLFTYQKKHTELSLKWLNRSLETRASDANPAINKKKQANTMRLAGVCLLALQDYDASRTMMKNAEDLCHDPIGAYLLLKLTVITKQPHALELLLKTIQDNESSLDVCIASISLFGDAQRVADAAAGFEKLFKRFQNDPKACVCTIGPRYFETLAALGNVEKAFQVLEDCCSSITQLSSLPEDNAKEVGRNGKNSSEDIQSVQYSRWSAILLAAGSAQADRKDFKSAANLLSRALRLARTSNSVSFADGQSSPCSASQSNENIVLKNEAAVCRLASSCALCSLDSKKEVDRILEDQGVSEEQRSEMTIEQKRISELALVHAERAKELAPSNFNARLLLFRIHLRRGDFEKAALELRNASADIHSFDPGAVAEAACAARDVGSTACVIGALRCILCMDTVSLSKWLEPSPTSPRKGFFGTVLLSCVNLLLNNEKAVQEGESLLIDVNVSDEMEQKKEGNEEILLKILCAGLSGVKSLSVDVVFDESKGMVEKSIGYLTDVAWNAGRKAGTELRYAVWEGFFSLCHDYCIQLPMNVERLQTRRMSLLMCACANVENPDSKKKDFLKAKDKVKEARRVSQMLQEVSASNGEDPIEGLLLILESRCCIGCYDLDALSEVVEVALKKEGLSAGVIEQLAAACYNYRNPIDKEGSESRMRSVDLTTALLSKASDIRLCSSPIDVKALAITMREYIGIEASRGVSSGRPFTVFQKATGIVVEHGEQFPDEERRWLVAMGWDRAQMHMQLGQNHEAKRWCEGVIKLSEECVALSTYLPRMRAFLETLQCD